MYYENNWILSSRVRSLVPYVLYIIQCVCLFILLDIVQILTLTNFRGVGLACCWSVELPSYCMGHPYALLRTSICRYCRAVKGFKTPEGLEESAGRWLPGYYRICYQFVNRVEAWNLDHIRNVSLIDRTENMSVALRRTRSTRPPLNVPQKKARLISCKSIIGVARRHFATRSYFPDEISITCV